MRKLTAATLALTVAGGVYLASGTAEASNMGFKLERSFTVVRTNPLDRRTANLNIYYLSFPLFNGLGDVGNSSVPGDRCVGDAGSTATPDGIIDSTDAICDTWTDRTGNISFQRFDRDTCQFGGETAAKGLGITFGGTPFVMERDAGFQIIVGSNQDSVQPVNRSVIVGSHDPSYTGRTVRAPVSGCLPKLDILNLPYHTMYQHSDEVLCGLEGVDWVDANADGRPDTCPSMTSTTQGGIFDGQNGAPHAITVETFNNAVGGNAFVTRSVTKSPLGGLSFPGNRFNLTPGDAYPIVISVGHTPTIFLSPHF